VIRQEALKTKKAPLRWIGCSPAVSCSPDLLLNAVNEAAWTESRSAFFLPCLHLRRYFTWARFKRAPVAPTRLDDDRPPGRSSSFLGHGAELVAQRTPGALDAVSDGGVVLQAAGDLGQSDASSAQESCDEGRNRLALTRPRKRVQ
jgi:hypothetical protein